MDPVRGRSGRFKIVGAVLDGDEVVNRFVLAGRIKGRVAKGTVSSYRFERLNPTVKCSRYSAWKAVRRAR